MKKLVSAGLAIIALAVAWPAIAADMMVPSYKAAPAAVAAPPTYNWSGWYIGANVGGGVAFVPVNDKDCFNCQFEGQDFKRGIFTGGGQIGWNRQLNPFFMAGIEADINGASFEESDTFSACSSCRVITHHSQLDWWGSVRARFGLTYSNTFIYVTAGPAYAHVVASMDTVDGSSEVRASEDNVHWGIAAGAGAEYMFAPNWIFRAEYLYLDFATHVYPVLRVSGNEFSCIGICRYSTNPSAQIARIGVSYLFGDGLFGKGPVVARY